MALLLNGTSQYLERDPLGLASATSFTACCWFNPSVLAGLDYRNLLTQWSKCGVSLWRYSGTTYALNFGDTTADTRGSDITTSTWYHVAWVRNGNSHTVYLNGVSDITATSSDSATRLAVGSYSNLLDFFGGQVAHLKIWDGVQLTQAEVQREMFSARPVRLSDLFLWSHFMGSTTADNSGYGRNWTAIGTPTLGDGPPVGWGASPMVVGQPMASSGPDYGTPYDHVGVWPFSSVWRPARV